jgi:hypothetical protein
MSEPAPAATVAPADGKGFLGTLVDVYFTPSEAFRGIVARPRWVVPLVALMLLNLAFGLVWTRKVDPEQYMREQLSQSGMIDRIPPEKQGEVVAQQAKLVKPMGLAGGLVFAPITYVILAAIFLFIYRFGFGGDVTFKQSFAVVLWGFLAVGLVTVPLMLLVLQLKGDWNIDPRFALQASPAALVERTGMSKPLYALLSALDLFSFWLVGLWAAGYAAALRTRFTSALFGVGGAWVVYVLGSVALAALF